MAHGTMTIDGDDVLNALSESNARTKFNRVLNSEGEILADLIAERALAEVLKRLGTKPEGD